MKVIPSITVFNNHYNRPITFTASREGERNKLESKETMTVIRSGNGSNSINGVWFTSMESIMKLQEYINLKSK